MQDYRMILFGFLMILTVQFFPKGIWGLFGRPGFP
jgi:ABC-type branched-subunit amino acid transport system permease subunit